jgi:hypothetical protein
MSIALTRRQGEVFAEWMLATKMDVDRVEQRVFTCKPGRNVWDLGKGRSVDFVIVPAQMQVRIRDVHTPAVWPHRKRLLIVLRVLVSNLYPKKMVVTESLSGDTLSTTCSNPKACMELLTRQYADDLREFVQLHRVVTPDATRIVQSAGVTPSSGYLGPEQTVLGLLREEYNAVCEEKLDNPETVQRCRMIYENLKVVRKGMGKKAPPQLVHDLRTENRALHDLVEVQQRRYDAVEGDYGILMKHLAQLISQKRPELADAAAAEIAVNSETGPATRQALLTDNPRRALPTDGESEDEAIKAELSGLLTNNSRQALLTDRSEAIIHDTKTRNRIQAGLSSECKGFVKQHQEAINKHCTQGRCDKKVLRFIHPDRNLGNEDCATKLTQSIYNDSYKGVERQIERVQANAIDRLQTTRGLDESRVYRGLAYVDDYVATRKDLETLSASPSKLEEELYQRALREVG